MNDPATESIKGKALKRRRRVWKKKNNKQHDQIPASGSGNISDPYVRQLREAVKTVRRPKKEYDCVKPESFCRYFLPGQVNNRSHAATQTDQSLDSHKSQPATDPLGRTTGEKENDSVAMEIFLKKLLSKHCESQTVESFQSFPVNKTAFQPQFPNRFTSSRTELIFLFATLLFSTFNNAYFLTCLILVIILLRMDSVAADQTPNSQSSVTSTDQFTDSSNTGQPYYPSMHKWFENRFVTVHFDKISAKDMDFESNYIFGEPLLDGESFSFRVSSFSNNSISCRSIAFGFTSVKNPSKSPIVHFMPHLSEFTDLDGLVWSFDPNLLSDPRSLAQVITIRREGQIIWLKIGGVCEEAILSLPIGTAYPFFCFNGNVKEIQMMRSESDTSTV